jgi:selenide,water dikinase
MSPVRNARLTLVNPDPIAAYTGILPGVLAGLYRPEEMEIDLVRLTQRCGVQLLFAEWTGVRADLQHVLLRDRPPVHYDILSIGCGSVPWMPVGAADSSGVTALPIKPMSTFLDRWDEALADVGRHPVRVAVIGGGAGGSEIAAGLAADLRRRNRAAEIELIDSNDQILRGYSPGAIRGMTAALERAGVRIRTSKAIVGIDPDALRFSDGTSTACDIAVWSTGAAPHPALASVELPKALDGFLRVSKTLLVESTNNIFAVGDAATIVESPCPKAGVYAVRQGPVLWRNLRAGIGRHQSSRAGRLTLRDYRPQRGFLSLLSAGDGTAVLDWKGFSAEGRWVWKLKDRIDTGYMRMHRKLYGPDRPGEAGEWGAGLDGGLDGRLYGRRDKGAGRGAAMPGRMTGSKSTAANMWCTGCGGKVSSGVLSSALNRLGMSVGRSGRTDHQVRFVRPEYESLDDATVLEPGSVDVMSVDFFDAFVNDPFLLGRLSVLHALSDLWAMGAATRGVQAIVTLPRVSSPMQAELLFQFLSGAVKELRAHGADLWGGHTIEGDTFQVGFSAAGYLGGQRPFTKKGLRPDDQLILTKPLGVGTLLAAGSRGACSGRDWTVLLDTMLQSNAAAAEVARRFDVQCATDITGFGLGGHLSEVLLASGSYGVEIDTDSIPLLPGFSRLTGLGWESTLAPDNRTAWTSDAIRLKLTLRGDSPILKNVLSDPQTCGGLLMAVPESRVAGLLDELRSAGYSDAACIGRVWS